MKAIKCELCGNNQLVKQGDYFVCQFCGTKYAPEAAKKLIVDIASPVSIDGAVEVTKGEAEKTKFLNDLNTLLELDQRAEFRKKLEIAIRDYPGEWEVWFLSFKWNFLHMIGDRILKKYDGSNIEKKAFNYYHEDDVIKAKQFCPDTQMTVLQKLYFALFDNLILDFKNQNSCISYNDAKKLLTFHYAFENQRWIDFLKEYIENYEKAAIAVKSELHQYKNKKNIYFKISDYYAPCMCFGSNIEHAEYFDGCSLNGMSFESRDGNREVHFYLTPEQFIKCVKEQNSTSGCYIATCVYGSYDCPEVWRLRRFRDSVLSKTWRGRLFIKTYYAISPKLVKWFGETVWFKRIWKAVIDRIGLDLKNKGFDDTPYIDE